MFKELFEEKVDYQDILARELASAKKDGLEPILYKKFQKMMMKSNEESKKALKQLERTHDVNYQGLEK